MSMTVLAVDDSATVRRMVSFALKGAGYDVIEATDGQAALEKLKAHPVNLVLTDHNMPVMDGLTFIRSLRGDPKYSKLPILVLTTESSDEMKAKGKEAGATGWLVKPFNPKRLVEIIKKVIGG